MEDMVGIADIAKRLNVEVSTVRRLIKNEGDGLGIKLHIGKGNKHLLSSKDADRLIAYYVGKRGPIKVNSQESKQFDKYGYFYIIQLVPEYSPYRVKIGFTYDVKQRLIQHKTAAPTAKLVKKWACKIYWEYAAIDSITREGCKLLSNEVYEGDIQKMIERGDKFFSIMPDSNFKIELSENSPEIKSR